jgi:anti-sigma regulatory factor (Ser/Thr protein kinase)
VAGHARTLAQPDGTYLWTTCLRIREVAIRTLTRIRICDMARVLEPASLELHLQARPEGAAGLRHELRRWLGRYGATGEEIFAILTATSEAFVNAVEHPLDPPVDRIDVDGSVVDGAVTLTVRDYGSWQDLRLRPGGHGFLLMRALMDAVDVERRRDGTRITMRRRLTGREDAVQTRSARVSANRSRGERSRPRRNTARTSR